MLRVGEVMEGRRPELVEACGAVSYTVVDVESGGGGWKQWRHVEYASRGCRETVEAGGGVLRAGEAMEAH